MREESKIISSYTCIAKAAGYKGITVKLQHDFFSSVLSQLSLFDLFVVEQTLKCVQCWGGGTDCKEFSKDFSKEVQMQQFMSLVTNSQEYQQEDVQEAKKACEGNWYKQLPDIEEWGLDNDATDPAKIRKPRKPLKQMVAKAFLYPVREGMEALQFVRTL